MSKTVLIADDDQALVQALALRCRAELGLETRTCTDGLEAYRIITREPPDLMILDYNMPAADGLYLLEELARDGERAPIPAIILTGQSNDETVQRCESLGAHYVWKGLDTWEQLKPVIGELLELESAAEPNHSPVATSEPPEEAPTPPSPTILVIDDDPDVSKAIKIRLEAYGVTTLRAFNGMQGYWTALKEKPDVVITDYNMPEGQGNYVIGRLQAHSATKDIPIIVLTGCSIDGVHNFSLERELRSIGAVAYLQKPLDFDALLTELARHIRIPPRQPRPASLATH